MQTYIIIHLLIKKICITSISVTFFISFRVQACMDNENECEELERKVPN